MTRTHGIIALLFSILLTFIVTTRAYAAPVIAQTWVGGTIYDASHAPIAGGGSGDNVTVNCNGHVQVVPFDGSGNYGATYPQTECKVGDHASASVAVSEGSGSMGGTVQNTTVNGPVVDLDIVVLDISVPEYGAMGAAFATMASVAGYVYMKSKAIL